MKPGDKVIFKGGSSQHPIIVKGTVFHDRSGLLVRDEQGSVCSTIGWKVETNSNNKEGDKQNGKE